MRALPSYDHTGSNITADGSSNQNEKYFAAYSQSDYDGPGRYYTEIKFNAEL